LTGRSRTYPGWQILILLLVLGGIIGAWIGDAFKAVWPAASILGNMQSVGIPGFSLDLGVISFSLGFMMHLNLFTIMGFIAAYMVYKRL
jgi:hypothetical protein